MDELKSIVEEMGYTVRKGIGSNREIFVVDENGNSATCVLDFHNEISAVSNRDVENEKEPEYFTANLNDKDGVIIAIEYAISKDRSFN